MQQSQRPQHPNPLLKTFIIGGFLLILIIVWFSNNRGKTNPQPIQTTSINELEKTKPINSVVKVEGHIAKIFKLKTDIMYITVSDSKEYISVVVFPNMGKLNDQLANGDQIAVTGILGSYKEGLQVQPLSKNDIKLVKKNTRKTEAPLVQLSAVNEYLNKTVKINTVTAYDVQTFTSKLDKEHLRFNLQQGNETIGAIMFEKTWTTHDLNMLENGQEINVIASVDEFNGNESLIVKKIEPADKGGKSTQKEKVSMDEESLESENSPSSEEPGSSKKPDNVKDRHKGAIPLSEASDYVGKTILIGPVSFEDGEEFTSNAGKAHLRFNTNQNGTEYDGVMFQGVWKDDDKEKVLSSGEFYVKAKVGTFNGRISLTVEEIEE